MLKIGLALAFVTGSAFGATPEMSPSMTPWILLAALGASVHFLRKKS